MATAAGLLPGVAFADQPGGTGSQTRTVTGTLKPDVPDWYYLPVDVPRGVRQIDVVYSYDKPPVPAGTRGNACDIGDVRPGGPRTGQRPRLPRLVRRVPRPVLDQRVRGHAGLPRRADRAGPLARHPRPVHGRAAGAELQGGHHADLRAGRGAVRAEAGSGAAPAKERGRAWYRGDCHLHTVYSDGRRTPDQLVADARAAGLDFIVSTDHNTSSSQLVWGKYATDDLLILNGEEVTTRSGHWPAIGLPAGTWIDWRYRAADPRDFRRFTDQVHRAGGLVTAAHPFANCFGCTYEFAYEIADLVEVWNGPWTHDDEASVIHWDGLLRGGRFIPAIGDSDAHNPDQRVALPHTVVLRRPVAPQGTPGRAEGGPVVAGGVVGGPAGLHGVRRRAHRGHRRAAARWAPARR